MQLSILNDILFYGESMKFIKHIPLVIILVLISSLFYLNTESYILNKYNHYKKTNNYERIYNLFYFNDKNLMSIDKFIDIYDKYKDDISIINNGKKLFIFNDYKLEFNNGISNNIEFIVPSNSNILIDGKDIEKYLIEDNDYDIYKKYNIDEMFISSYEISISNEVSEINKKIIPNEKTYSFEYSNSKIKVYVFKENKCPYCINEIEYLKELKSEYNDIFDYELIEYSDKYDLFKSVLKHFDAPSEGYPFTVMGDDYLYGFSNSDKTKLKRKIFEAYRNKKENYVDTIK